MSAAPYAHQWHTKPNIFGLNLNPVLMRSQLLYHYSRLCPFPVRPLSPNNKKVLLTSTGQSAGGGLNRLTGSTHLKPPHPFVVRSLHL